MPESSGGPNRATDLLALPTRARRLRLVAQTRRLALAVLPLGAAIGAVAALALAGLEHLQHLVRGHVWQALLVLLPAAGLFLSGLWLQLTGLGEVSLTRDLHEARTQPLATFGLGSSLGKAVACALTIGFGGSAGVEGPAKWLGAAVGAQFHGLLRWAARRQRRLRRLLTQPRVVVTAGSAAALAAIFRAPLSGALLAAEHEGELSAAETTPALVAAATGYLAFIAIHGTAPLLGTPQPYRLVAREAAWALPLGLACAVAASLFRRLLRWTRAHLKPLPLGLRGLVAGGCRSARPAWWCWRGSPSERPESRPRR